MGESEVERANIHGDDEGRNQLGLRELLQRYAESKWVANHLTPEQAAVSVLDCFKRAAAGELELLDLEFRTSQRRTQALGG